MYSMNQYPTKRRPESLIRRVAATLGEDELVLLFLVCAS